MAILAAFPLVFNNLQPVWASPTLCVPKYDSFKFVSDYQAVDV